MTNGVASAPLGAFYTDGMERFDRLPIDIRRALHEAVCDWCPGETLKNFERLVRNGFDRKSAAQVVAASLRDSDRAEVKRFARDYRRRGYGPYPAVAAKASIMRYDERQAWLKRSRS